MKILLLAHGGTEQQKKEYSRCVNNDYARKIISSITSTDEVYTVDINSEIFPDEIVDLRDPKINKEDKYFDYIIDCGGLAGSTFYYKKEEFWKEMNRLLKENGIFFARPDQRWTLEKLKNLLFENEYKFTII